MYKPRHFRQQENAFSHTFQTHGNHYQADEPSMFYDGDVHIEEDDQCFTCEHFLKGVQCPLLEALAEKVVFLDDDIVVRNCGFYREFKRHLTLLKPGEDESGATDETPSDDEPTRRIR